MKILDFKRCAFIGCAVLALLAGCAPLPLSLSQGNAASNARVRTQKASPGGALIYTAPDFTTYEVNIFTYPAGKLVTDFKPPGAPGGLCSDTRGNVFMTDFETGSVDVGNVYEYAHAGKSPVATLDLPNREIPVNCSSDPTTGNLAVTSYNVRNFAPLVEIYTGGSGTPKLFHSTELGADPQPAYDASGNLFVTSGGNVSALLAKGKQKFEKIELNVTLGNVAHAQWDGKYFSLQSYTPTKHNGENVYVHFYRVQVSGSTGTIVGTSKFVNWRQKNAGQSWIQADTVVATPGNSITFWKYPAGGKAFKVLHPSDPSQAVTVSTVP